MRVSKEWLNDYIDVENVDYIKLADKMTLIGNELDSVEVVSEATGLVVGQIKTVEKHPNADKLNVCTVDVGNTLTIVCGGTNLAVGLKVIVALDGAILPGNFKIKKTNIRDIESNGMICALTELGIDNKYVIGSEIDHGIHILPSDAPIGTDAIKYLKYDDIVADYELTSNRGDLLSMIGMAYETGAIIGNKVNLPEISIDDTVDNKINIKVDSDNCSLYSARKVNNVVIGESPRFIRDRLMKVGIRSINNVVDISNYVMIEYGQPLHFFDYDKLGNDVSVRMAKENEVIVTLDNIERKLTNDDLVICNDKEPVALAGVMGGLSTEVDENTNNILIESAVFDPIIVRRTANKILRSESSNRFEKGINPDNTVKALNRAAELLSKYASGNVDGGISKIDNIEYKEKKIKISLDKIISVLGMNITNEKIEEIFDGLGLESLFENEIFIVSIPKRRMDLNIEEDLIEEIGRIYGYGELNSTLPIVEIKRGTYEHNYLVIKKIKERLCGLGLTEARNYSLVPLKYINMFTNSNEDGICVIDPMSEDKKYLRNSLVPELYDNYKYNKARNNNNINIFEIGKGYYGDFVEEDKLAILISGYYLEKTWNVNGIKSNFYILKGILDNLFKYLGVEYSIESKDIPKEYHPYKSGTILVSNNSIGHIGQIHPNISKEEIFVLEINLVDILKSKLKPIISTEVSKYPTIQKDLSFVIEGVVVAKELVESIKKAGGELLKEVNIFDVYENNNESSIAFNLVFGDRKRTLTDDEVKNKIEEIIAFLENNNNVKLKKNI